MVDKQEAVTKPMRLNTFPQRLLNADFEQGQVVERTDQGVSSRNPDTTLNHLGNPNRPCLSRRAAARSR